MLALLLAALSAAADLPHPDWCDVVEVSSGGFDRAALIHLPDGYAASDRSYPVVLMFHGGEGSAKQAANWWSDWKGEDVILVFPNGQTEVPELGGWSAVNGDRSQHVTFVRDLLASLDQTYRIDASRRYAVGFSHGGYQTFKLFCQASDLFAGFAVVSQTLDLEDAKTCKPGGKPLVWMMGDEDPKSYWHGRPGTLSVEQTLDVVLAQGGCASDPTVDLIDTVEDGTRVRRARYERCSKVPSIEFLRIEGGVHSWPGKDSGKPGQCQDIEAPAVALDYWRRAGGL